MGKSIKGALLDGQTTGRRAATTGEQTIRLTFPIAQSIRRIHLRFAETRETRTQEYVLRWSREGDMTCHVIARQQWKFSPGGSTSQIEDHRVDLPEMQLELVASARC